MASPIESSEVNLVSWPITVVVEDVIWPEPFCWVGVPGLAPGLVPDLEVGFAVCCCEASCFTFLFFFFFVSPLNLSRPGPIRCILGGVPSVLPTGSDKPLYFVHDLFSI